MFYAPEILSLKNKTELSMLYYISTAKGFRRLSRKSISRMDIGGMVNEIESPRVPFSLRLYAYLLSGLVRVWLVKVDCCVRGIRMLVVPVQRRSRVERPKAAVSPNLELEEEFIDHVEDSRDATQGLVLGTCDGPDFSDGPNSAAATGNVLRRRLPTKLDSRSTLGAEDVFVRRLYRPARSLPDSIGCFIVESFKRLLAGNDRPADSGRGFDDCFAPWSDEMACATASGSVEEPRLSDSKASDQRLSDSRLSEHNPPSSETSGRLGRALWFYSVLLGASAGHVVVEQEEPFGEILVF